MGAAVSGILSAGYTLAGILLGLITLLILAVLTPKSLKVTPKN